MRYVDLIWLCIRAVCTDGKMLFDWFCALAQYVLEREDALIGLVQCFSAVRM